MGKSTDEINQATRKILSSCPVKGKHEGYLMDYGKEIEEKPGGAELGRMVHNVSFKRSKSFTFIEKIGLGKFDATCCEFRDFQSIFQKICLDFYRIYGAGASSRIGLISTLDVDDIINATFKTSIEDRSHLDTFYDFSTIGKVWTNDSRENKHVVLRSKLIKNYKDLGEDFVEYIVEHGVAPSTIRTEEVGEVVLKGFMRNAAVAKILGNIDWLGATGRNTGYTIKESPEGGFFAEAITVDAGEALTYLPFFQNEKEKYLFEEQQIDDLTSLDIQINLNRRGKIFYSKLTNEQKEEYKETLKQLLDLTEENIRELVNRNNVWNRLIKSDSPGEEYISLLSEEAVAYFVNNIFFNINMIKNNYAYCENESDVNVKLF